MKSSKLVALAGIMLLSLYSLVFAEEVQLPDKRLSPLTRIEAFTVQKGVLVIRDYYYLGDVEDITFAAIVAYSPDKEADKIKGVRIGLPSLGGHKNVHTVFFDVDELDEIKKVLVYFDKLAARWVADKKSNYTEASYSTRDNFEIDIYKKPTTQAGFIKRLFGREVGSNPDPVLYLQANNYENVFRIIDFDQIPELLKIIDKGIETLASK